jgi:hypothetical protein
VLALTQFRNFSILVFCKSFGRHTGTFSDVGVNGLSLIIVLGRIACSLERNPKSELKRITALNKVC